MDKNMRNKINQIVEVIRREFNINVPIGDMDQVVRILGGEIDYDSSLAEFADGKIEKYRNRESNFKISISPLQSDTRKRFSIAHEIGHLFMHMGYMIDNELWNSTSTDTFYRKLNGEVEYHANEFAAAFLMPRDEYHQKLIENHIGDGRYNVSIVAEYFGVSLEAAVNRGRWLGYLSW